MNRIEKICRLADDISRPFSRETRMLDFGCGAGNQVQNLLDLGFDCHGCDLAFKTGPHVESLRADGRVHTLQLEPYRLPFEDNSFDFIYSDQVFEHVLDYGPTLRELRRVLRDDGWSLHIFPSKWRLREAHLGTPFGGALKYKWWTSAWATLGCHRSYPDTLDRKEIIQRDWEYLMTCTNYLSQSEIHRAFQVAGFQIQHLERESLKYSGHRWISHSRKFPGVTRLARLFGAHIFAAW